jgi:D-sedoheptulose 7-phosphate isomerase
MLTPLDWIEQLRAAIVDSQCRVKSQVVSLSVGLEAIAEEFRAARARESNVWWVGNGGSAALCSHLSQDLLNKIGLRSLALTDSALLSCMANDYGYSEVYRRPLSVLARENDLLIAVSSSGNSENILRCVDLARDKDMRVITLSGFHADNSLRERASDVSVYLPCELYGHAEVGHETLLHSVIETLWLERERENAAPETRQSAL